MLWLSGLDFVVLDERAKVFIWRKVGPARRVNLPSQTGYPARRLTFLAESTLFAFHVIISPGFVRKCRKHWSTKRSWGRWVKIQAGISFLHIHTQSNYDRFAMKNPSLITPIRFSIKYSSERAYLVNRFCCYFKFFSALLQEFYLFLIFPKRNCLEAYPHILEHGYIAQIDANLSVSMFECFIWVKKRLQTLKT